MRYYVVQPWGLDPAGKLMARFLLTLKRLTEVDPELRTGC